MIRNGEAYVPPTCPTLKTGDSRPIALENFQVYAEPDGDSGVTAVVYYSDINNDLEEVFGMTCAEFRESADSESSRAAQLITSTGSDAYLQVGAILTENVRNCHGVEDGECWALGKRACQAAILSVSHDIS